MLGLQSTQGERLSSYCVSVCYSCTEMSEQHTRSIDLKNSTLLCNLHSYEDGYPSTCTGDTKFTGIGEAPSAGTCHDSQIAVVFV